MGSWNVRTLYQTGKLAQVRKEMERCKLEILGISEARWTSFGKTAKHKYRLYYSGHKETDAPHTLGVGIMMSPLAQKALMRIMDQD